MRTMAHAQARAPRLAHRHRAQRDLLALDARFKALEEAPAEPRVVGRQRTLRIKHGSATWKGDPPASRAHQTELEMAKRAFDEFTILHSGRSTRRGCARVRIR